jgi:hypothetical protein
MVTLFTQYTKCHFLELETVIFRNTRVLKSLGTKYRAGSIPAPGTNVYNLIFLIVTYAVAGVIFLSDRIYTAFFSFTHRVVAAKSIF